MKLRRALAAAAATAAIAPLALFAAPNAFAEGSPTPTATDSTPAGENTPTAPESTPADPATTPEAPASTPAGSSSPSTTASSSAGASSSPSTSPSGSATTSSSPSPSESGKPVDECDVDEDDGPVFNDSDALHSSLTGLPESIVAGSGWTNFKFNVSNSGDDTIKDIQPIVGVGAVDWNFEEDYTDLVTVQVKQGGAWVDVTTEFGEGGAFNAFSLDGGDSLSYQLRVKVSRKVPSAIGIAIGLAQYSDDKGCWVSSDENAGIYYFEVLPAGSNPGKPNDAKPQTGGKSPISDVNSVDVDGRLADTGSSSALPVIGLVGGFAVVAGTGVVFAVKRRKGVTGAHA
jgi:LPXTG-motif cell wall-anchored protein